MPLRRGCSARVAPTQPSCEVNFPLRVDQFESQIPHRFEHGMFVVAGRGPGIKALGDAFPPARGIRFLPGFSLWFLARENRQRAMPRY